MLNLHAWLLNATDVLVFTGTALLAYLAPYPAGAVPQRRPTKWQLFGFTWLLTFFGWEWWWATGAGRWSTPYHTRFLEAFPDTTPTTPDVLHAGVQAWGDATAVLWLVAIAHRLVPDGWLHWDARFLGVMVVLGVAQNIVITCLDVVTPYDPTRDVLSWSPLAGDANCADGLRVCVANQRVWVVVPVVVYGGLVY